MVTEPTFLSRIGSRGLEACGEHHEDARRVRSLVWFSRSQGATEGDLKLTADDSRDAILPQGFAEVLRVPHFHSGEAEVGEHMLLVRRIDLFNGLAFHNPRSPRRSTSPSHSPAAS